MGPFEFGEDTVLREFVVKLLGAEDGADEVLRRAWAQFEKMKLPPGADYRADLLGLAEKAAHDLRRKAPQSAGTCADTSRSMIVGNQPDALT